MVNSEKLIYKANDCTYIFQQLETIRSFAKITISNADKDQDDLYFETGDFNKSIKPEKPIKKAKK